MDVDININNKIYTLRRRSDPGFGPRDENEATNGAGVFFISWVLYITADADLQ